MYVYIYVYTCTNIFTLFVHKYHFSYFCTWVKPVLRGHIWDKRKVALYDRWPHKKDSIHTKFSMTGQEKDDLLIQVTA